MNLGDLSGSYTAMYEYVETSQKRRELTNDLAEVGLIGSTQRMGKPYTGGSDQRQSDRLRGLSD